MVQPRARRRATSSFLSALLVVTGCSKILDFDPKDAGPSDASNLDGSEPVTDGAQDLYEPNDTPQEAIPLGPGEYDLTIYPEGDQDYWRLNVSVASDVVIEVEIDGGADLDLELFSISDLDNPVAWSRGAAGRESIVRTEAENGQLGPGVFILRVFAFVDHASAAYTLSLSIGS